MLAVSPAISRVLGISDWRVHACRLPMHVSTVTSPKCIFRSPRMKGPGNSSPCIDHGPDRQALVFPESLFTPFLDMIRLPARCKTRDQE